MRVLNLIDTEYETSDSFKETLFPRLAIPNNNNTFYISEKQYESDGIKIFLKETAFVEISPNIPTLELEEIAQANEGISYLTHKSRLVLPSLDDEETFNYNNYATDAFSYYNIRNDDYEIYSENNDEKSLPNFCLGALWSRGEETSEQLDYYTMFGAIPSLQSSNMLASSTPINNYEFDDEYLVYDNVDPELETKKDYFKLLLRSGSINTNEYIEANTHVFVDFNYNLNDSAQIGNTPFFNRIRLPNLSPLATNPNNNFFEGVYPSEIVGMFLESSMTDKLLKSFRNSNSFLREFQINNTTTQLKVYDLMEMFETISYSGALRENDEMFLRSGTKNYANDDNNPFTFYFYKLLLLGKLRAKMKGKLKSFQEIIVENVDHETEHVGFKVVKRISGRTEPIQTFYFMNTAGLEDFIDTQVRFDRLYSYEVVGMFAVYGSNYTYDDIEVQNPVGDGGIVQGRFLRIDFINRPSVKIVEVPLANHSLRVVEPPPIVPEIGFYNEMTTKNKLKIRMEHQDGNIVDEYAKKPMRPFSGNQEYIDKLKEYFNSDNVLVTSGKTSNGVYEIYRLEEPPKSYLDFEEALIATVQSAVIYNNGTRSRNAMFTDLIKHQQKYYYAFRTLTHRGNPSELSSIYVVEMYEDADETFLTFDLYQMPENSSYQASSHMRKYIQIIPNQEHTNANNQELLDDFETAQDALTALTLGNSDLEEKLFSYNNENKYIKLRLESKNSGRKMDINLFFKRKITNN